MNNSQFTHFNQNHSYSVQKDSASGVKRKQIQQTFRKNQIAQKMREMRQQCLNAMSQDYWSLKDINLSDIIHRFKNFDINYLQSEMRQLQRIISAFFIYSNTQQSDHLHCLLDQYCIQKLVELVNWKNIGFYDKNPRLYIKIFLILTLYSSYNYMMPAEYFKTLQYIGRQLIAFENHYEKNEQKLGFSNNQLKILTQFTFQSLSYINLKNVDAIDFFIASNDCFVNLALREGEKLIHFLIKQKVQVNQKEFSILRTIICFFKEVLIFQTNIQDLKIRIYQLDVSIINFLLQVLTLPQNICQVLQNQIINTLYSFMIIHIPENPNILLVHHLQPLFKRYKYLIENICSIFDSQIYQQKYEQKSKQVATTKMFQKQKKVQKYLQILHVIFGVQIPEDQSQNYLVRMNQWLHRFIMPTFSRAFTINDSKMYKFFERMLLTIKDLTYEDSHLEMVLHQLSIMNKIFFFIQSEYGTVTLKKRSLHFLACMIQTSLDLNFKVKSQVLEIINNNKMIEILASTIGMYADHELNTDLLQALQIWLQSQTCENASQNSIWNLFCLAEGLKTLDRVVKNDGIKTKTYQIANYILDQYDIN